MTTTSLIFADDPTIPHVFNDAFLATLPADERNRWLDEFSADLDAWCETRQDDPYYAAILKAQRAGVL